MHTEPDVRHLRDTERRLLNLGALAERLEALAVDAAGVHDLLEQRWRDGASTVDAQRRLERLAARAALVAELANAEARLLSDALDQLPARSRRCRALSVVGLIAALALAASPFPDPWLGSEGLDVVQVSSGEAVTLSDHLIPGRFTIFDFGAAWCAPCHDAAHTLKGYLAVHPDVAVRAISLEGDPWDTAALPAAQEHLPGRGRIPHFIVFDPSGQRIYQGHRVNRALRRVDRRRQRANQASSLSK